MQKVARWRKFGCGFAECAGGDNRIITGGFWSAPLRGAPGPVLERWKKPDVDFGDESTAGRADGTEWRSCMWWNGGEFVTRTWSGVTPQIMQQGMRTDYKLVDKLSRQMRERNVACENSYRQNRSGPRVRSAFDHKLDWVKTSG